MEIKRDKVTAQDESLSTLQVSKAGKLICFSVGEFLAAAVWRESSLFLNAGHNLSK